MNTEIVVERIELLAKNNGISKTKALTQSGAGKDFIANIKKGQTPSIAKLQKIAEYFGVSVDYLLGTDAGDVVSSGSNNNIQNGNNNNIEITACDYDINEKKLIEKFRELDYDEQIQLMAEVIERVKGKETE